MSSTLLLLIFASCCTVYMSNIFRLLIQSTDCILCYCVQIFSTNGSAVNEEMVAIFERSVKKSRFPSTKAKRAFSSSWKVSRFKLQDAKCLDYSSRAVRNTAWRTVKYDSHKFPRATNFHQFLSSSFPFPSPTLFSGKSETLDTFHNLRG